MRPLEGIKVLELANYVAAPSAAATLGEWGATVIKVEGTTGAGDVYRTLGLSFNMPDQTFDDYNNTFDTANCNKQFISLNMKTPEGMEAFHKILVDADVLVTNWRENALKKLSLDYDSLKDRYPKLVYGHLIGYGEKGPAKDLPGFDVTTYFARGGILASLPQEGNPPLFSPPCFGDLNTGMALSGGICAALIKKERTGRGDKVTATLFAAALYAMTELIVSTKYGNKHPKNRKTTHTALLNNSFQGKDGRWFMLCYTDYDGNYNKVVKMLGREDLVDHPLYSNLQKILEAKKNVEVTEILEVEFAKKSAAEWVKTFEEWDVPGALCALPEDILVDPQAWDNDFLMNIPYANGEEGLVVPSPVRFKETGTPPIVPSRGLGFHTGEILSKYGYSEEQISDMEAKGAAKRFKVK